MITIIRAIRIFILFLFIGSNALWALDANDVDSIGQRHELKAFVFEKRRRFDLGGVQMGALRLMGDEVKAMPTAFGEPDVLRTLQATPGVQRGKNGNVGLMVRGGGYDQNTMMVDGALLYSTDHLKGFVTAVNPDIVDNISFYRGAFPVQYAGRLSSVIAIEAKQGDFNRWHAEASAGLSMARINAGGPIVHGKTSVAVAARMSYFGLIFRPIVDHHYKKLWVTNPYSNLDFWDVNAKFSQRLGSSDLLTLTATVDRDKQNTPARKTPRGGYNFPYYMKGDKEGISYDTKEDGWMCVGNLLTSSLTTPGAEKTIWSNRVAALNWLHNFGDPSRCLITTAAYSSYRFRNSRSAYIESNELVDFAGGYWRADSTVRDYRENSSITQHSDIRNLRVASVMSHRLNAHHSLTYGLEGRFVHFDPRRHIVRDIYDYKNWCKRNPLGEIFIDHRNELTLTNIDTLTSNVQNGSSFSAFVGDEINYGPLKASVGGNITVYCVKDKTYLSLEPRVSLCFYLKKNTYLKASFSRMSQGERLLMSTSIKSPGDFWVTVTDSVPPMRATQYSLSLSQRLPLNIELSVEGYYKRSTGNIEYLDGVDYTDISTTWQQQVAIGRARSWGVELMAQRDLAPLTGWVSYTFSRSHEQYDTPGCSINSGAWFAAAADRPHNLQVFAQYNLPFKRYSGNSIDFAVHFSYMSGRKMTFPDHVTYAGMLRMADHYGDAYGWSSLWSEFMTDDIATLQEGTIVMPEDAFDQYMRLEGYSKRYNYTLPSESSLDITVTLNVKHKRCLSRLTIGVTNLLNKKNISNLYLTNNAKGEACVKGVCDFPIMPVFSYSFSF